MKLSNDEQVLALTILTIASFLTFSNSFAADNRIPNLKITISSAERQLRPGRPVELNILVENSSEKSVQYEAPHSANAPFELVGECSKLLDPGCLNPFGCGGNGKVEKGRPLNRMVRLELVESCTLVKERVRLKLINTSKGKPPESLAESNEILFEVSKD